MNNSLLLVMLAYRNMSPTTSDNKIKLSNIYTSKTTEILSKSMNSRL